MDKRPEIYKRMKHKFGDAKNYGSFKDTKEVKEATEITLREAKELNARIVIFQSPASFKPSDRNARAVIDYFSILDKKFKYGWEPRGEWYNELELLRKVVEESGVIHVVDPFKHTSLTTVKYYRLHGIGKGEVNYSYKYTDDDLEVLKNMVTDGSYVMFNNIYSFDDALRFKKLLSAK